MDNQSDQPEQPEQPEQDDGQVLHTYVAFIKLDDTAALEAVISAPNFAEAYGIACEVLLTHPTGELVVLLKPRFASCEPIDWSRCNSDNITKH